MNLEKDYTDLIERYLDGEMVAQEQSAFEKQIAESPSLAKEVHLQKTLRNGIANQPTSIYQILRQVEQERAEMAKKKTRILNRRRMWGAGIAAGLALLLLVFFPGQFDKEAFQARYGIDLFEIERGGNPLYPKIQAAYEEGAYEEGLSMIRELQQTGASNPKYLRFLESGFYLEMRDSARTISSLTDIVEDNSVDNLYADMANQQLAMAYVVFDDTDQAIEILEQMEKDESLSPKQRSDIRAMLADLR
ncbi:MAG: hypothetical protein AAF587_00610 [Bacteroidota bacterium]